MNILTDLSFDVKKKSNIDKLKEENKKKYLRARRETECFPIINRGKLWYNCLTDEQVTELDVWYHKWLNVTETMVIPDKPEFLRDKLYSQEEVL